MGVKSLAEGILCQSLEDLWDDDLRDESLAFFASSDFSSCAQLARMNVTDQIELLTLVSRVIGELKTPIKTVPCRQRDRRKLGHFSASAP
jgi:hypothetical protein